jgi:hypothetical protein
MSRSGSVALTASPTFFRDSLVVIRKDFLSSYLQQYAEVEARNIADDQCWFALEDCVFDHCLAIPFYDEDIACLQRLKRSTLAQKKLLIIAVVNQPDRGQQPTEKNQQLWRQLALSGETLCQYASFQIVRWPDTQTVVLMVDRFSTNRGIPDKQGVGLARKIACDLACRFIQRKILRTSWIHCSDADVTLPAEYFENSHVANLDLENHGLSEKNAAILYPFSHVGENNALTAATHLYERSLHHYVNGLTLARSPYAFHTIGSCLAINVRHYAQVRGFPKRAAAEDFYVLNKLAKLGKIQSLKHPRLLIRARLSDRVPFGTGVAAKQILLEDRDENSLPAYHPQVFHELKQLLANLSLLYENKQKTALWMTKNSRFTQHALEVLGVETLFRHLQKQISSEKQWQLQSHLWFDGFRTLKFIHQLEASFPKIPLIEAEKGIRDLCASAC